jgi:formylglycine-generating enzyme required for sulfatase activity
MNSKPSGDQVQLGGRRPARVILLFASLLSVSDLVLGAFGAVPPSPVIAQSSGQTRTNSLGMVFRAITNSAVLVCVWETRVQDYGAFVSSSGYRTEALTTQLRDGTFLARDWQHPGFEQSAVHPVVMVSWEDAKAFCEWLTQRERDLKLLRAGESYRLPTDDEWSRAVGSTRYPWLLDTPRRHSQPLLAATTGSGQDDRQWFPPPPGAGNYAGTELQQIETRFRVIRNYTDGFVRTAPVGSFPPLPNGLHDLGGNVAEFCLDWFRDEMNGPELQPKLPFHSNDGGGRVYRVVRGASWLDSHPGRLRADCRFFEFPDHRGDYLGFRVVLDTSPPR